MSKQLVRNRDSGAKVTGEHGCYIIRLSCGREMPPGRTISHAWRLAHQQLYREANPIVKPQSSGKTEQVAGLAYRLGIAPKEFYRD